MGEEQFSNWIYLATSKLSHELRGHGSALFFLFQFLFLINVKNFIKEEEKW